MQHPTYKGEKLKVTRKVKNSNSLNPYFPDDDLTKAVNLALLLNRPLLIMGEPGCGKSLLASAVAYEWYGNFMLDSNKFFEWNIKSTSRAKDGLYEIDNLQRLQDANFKTEIKTNLDIKNYIKDGPMALAMKNSLPLEKSVLLIDEIDKADIDFSNDLLNEIEKNSYTIPELKITYPNKETPFSEKPFIIITSNGEKDLSDAFLRRCVFHYIDLFSPTKLESDETRKWLERIVNARFGVKTKKDDVRDKAIATFIKLRKKLNTDQLTYRKTVSTSEFIDWFQVLQIASTDKVLAKELNIENDLKEFLKETSNSIPFGNVLFKTTKSLLDLPTAQ